MTKGKKKKKKDKKSAGQSSGLFSPRTAKRLQEISRNPLVADVVAATLISAASALRDSKKAQQIAANAGDELEELAHRGAKSGNALWQLALDVGRKSLEALVAEDGPKRRKPKPVKKKTAAAAKKRKPTAGPAKRRSAKSPADA